MKRELIATMEIDRLLEDLETLGVNTLILEDLEGTVKVYNIINAEGCLVRNEYEIEGNVFTEDNKTIVLLSSEDKVYTKEEIKEVFKEKWSEIIETGVLENYKILTKDLVVNLFINSLLKSAKDEKLLTPWDVRRELGITKYRLNKLVEDGKLEIAEWTEYELSNGTVVKIRLFRAKDLENISEEDLMSKFNWKSYNNVADETLRLNLEGKSVCLTGTFKTPRGKLKELLESKGVIVKNTVTKKTEVLIAGIDGGSKVIKAQEQGIKIIGESALYEYLELEDKTVKEIESKSTSVVVKNGNSETKSPIDIAEVKEVENFDMNNINF